MRTFADPAELATITGQQLGTSSWWLIDQPTVDAFAAVTGDHQWIHTDVAAAADGPFGGTVVHGLLVLSLFPALLAEVFQVGNSRLVLNKELRRVKFQAPVPVGSRVRAEVRVITVRSRPRGFWEAEFRVTAELAVSAAIAVSADQVFLYQQ